jgi:Rrf2 family protein
MRTSCRFAMAVHILAVLAYRQGGRATSGFLAGSVNTNPVIIRRLLLALQKARLVDTCRGAGAGSRLSRPPRRISLAQIYRSVEAPEAFATPSREPNADCPVGHAIRKTLAGVFSSAQAALERDLARTSLADVLARLEGPAAGRRKKTV